MKEEIPSALGTCPLFFGCDPTILPSILERAQAYEVTFPSGASIPFRDRSCGRIGILLRGKAGVFSSEDERTPLNRLQAGSLFGVSTLYADGCADTVVIAETEVSVLFLEEENLDPLWENPETRKNLIAFLTDRIRFLTEKIASFTAPCAEKKLARFLFHHREADGTVSAIRSFSDLAKSLNLGRASLYRALEKMESENLIEKNGKRIRILSPERLAEFL